MNQIIPYMNFKGNCREVLTFYKDCLDAELTLQTIGESPMAPTCPAAQHGLVMHATLSKNGVLLMGSDMAGPDGFIFGNNVALSLNCSSLEEINHYFEALSTGGKVMEPVKMQFWGAYFAAFSDQFGNRWMLNFDPAQHKQTRQNMRKEVLINASRQKVWQVLLDDATYRQWTTPFHPGSYAETDWQEGSKVLFKTPEGNGMVSRVAVHQPESTISFEHLGILVNGEESYDHPQVKDWQGSRETYFVTDEADGTRLVVEQDAQPEHISWLDEVWDKALAIVKQLAETASVPVG